MNKIRSVSFFMVGMVFYSYAFIRADSCNGISFNQIQERFENIHAWGLETTLDMSDCDAQKIRDAQAIKDYVHQLCDVIDMKRFGDTEVVYFGQDEAVAGYSMTQLIETSLISGHFVNINNAVYINIFSCKLYDPYVVAEFTKKFFCAHTCTMNVLFRK